MKKFGKFLSDLINEYTSNTTTMSNLEQNPQFFLSNNWEKIPNLFQDAFLQQAIKESFFKQLEKGELLLKAQNSSTKFLLTMNASLIIIEVNKMIKKHCKKTDSAIYKIKIVLS